MLTNTSVIIAMAVIMFTGTANIGTAQPSRQPDETSSTRAVWAYPFFMDNLGASNIWAGETANGSTEIYFGCTVRAFADNQYWVALTYNTASQTYDTVFTSQYFNAGIKKTLVGNVQGDEPLEIVIALADGTIYVYDQFTKSVIDVFPTLSSLTSARLKDLDNDNIAEIIVGGDASVAAYKDGIKLWEIPVSVGNDIEVGQFDADPGLEVATATGSIVDIDSRSVQWEQSKQYLLLQAHDIDGDNMDELITAEWYAVKAHDIDLQSEKWSHPTPNDISALSITDFDNDGNVEIGIGDAQWGNVYGIDPVTRNLKYSRPNPDSGVTGLVAADVDLDGQRELIWGTGSRSSGADSLLIVNAQTNDIKWQTNQLDGPVHGPAKGDLDGDGIDEVVIGAHSSRAGYGVAALIVFDSQTMQLRALTGLDEMDYLYDLTISDIDHDGEMEIIVATRDRSDGLIQAYDFNTSNIISLKWQVQDSASGSPFYRVEVVDLDGDGEKEVIAGGSRATTASDGSHLYVYSSLDGSLKWRTLDALHSRAAIMGLAAADLLTSPGLEIVANVNNGSAFIYNLAVDDLLTSITGEYTALSVFDNTIFLADTAGYLNQFEFVDDVLTTGPTVKLETTSQFQKIDAVTVLEKNPLSLHFSFDGSLYHYNNGAIQNKSVNYGKPYGSNYIEGFSAGSYALLSQTLPMPVINPEPAFTTGTVNLISWAPTVSGAEYLVQASTDENFASPLSSGWMDKTSHLFNELSTGQVYYYRVKLRLSDSVTESAWSSIVQSMQVAPDTRVDTWELY